MDNDANNDAASQATGNDADDDDAAANVDVAMKTMR
jgi:hypothetical protein